MSDYRALPPQLKDLPNWVVWKYETRKGKRTKPLFDAKSNGAHCYAKTNDAATWASFERAVKAADPLEGSDYEGVGFVFTDTNYIGIDLDGVVKDDGTIDPYAVQIMKLANTYCELSPSGKGVHIIFESALALPAGNRSGNKELGGEIYDKTSPRYFTCTGDKIAGYPVSPRAIADQDTIDLLHFLVMQLPNVKFTRLWMGDTSLNENDHSKADLALVGMLAHQLNGDRARIEKYFGASLMARPEKWDARPDYRERTINKALAGKTVKQSASTAAPNIPIESVAVSGVSRTASSIKPHRLQWLWEKRIPLSKIVLFAGNPDNGKSLAANSIAATLTTGRPFPDYPNMIPPSDVLMMLGEDDLEDTAIPRLMAAGADLDKIHFLEGVMRGNKEGDVRLDVDMPVLEKKFQEFPNARLLIIDPISNFLGDTNMFGEQDVRAKVLVPLKQLAAKYKVSVIIIMHLNKKQDLDAISRVGGAMAFIGIARCSWLFSRDEASDDGVLSENFTMSRMKNNLTAASLGGLSYKIEFNEQVFQDEDGAVGAPYVAWGSVVHKSADQALGTSRREVGRPTGSDSKMKDAVQFLTDALADGRRLAADLFEEADHVHNIKKRTLVGVKADESYQRARANLVERFHRRP